MNAETYYKSLTKEQQDQVQKQIDKASDLGLDLTIHDAVDIWYLLDRDTRGPKPPEEA